jgi:carbamoyl-phosphate synthase large subunit
VCGSASLHINKVSSDEELTGLFSMYEDLMIQEYMSGQEYGADVYVDMISGKCTSVFIKKKIKMRAGETDKSVSVHIPELFDKISSFTEAVGFRGIIDIDIFEKDGDYYFSEINPRFGGGYPHAYACGVNVPRFIINNLKGIENPVSIGDYEDGICMMKYNEIMIKKIEDPR